MTTVRAVCFQESILAQHAKLDRNSKRATADSKSKDEVRFTALAKQAIEFSESRARERHGVGPHFHADVGSGV